MWVSPCEFLAEVATRAGEIVKADDIIKINCASYRDNLNAWIDYSSKINMEAFHKYFCGMLRPAARILDAGCGTGRDSLALQERGFRVDAFDASEEMVELAKSIGINARVGNLQSLSARNRYDGIWACASLIHVPRIQLNDVIKRLVRALKPKGILFIALKEGIGESFECDGRFTSYHQLDGFTDLLAWETGARIVSSWRSRKPRRYGSPRWLYFVIRKQRPATRFHSRK